MYVMTISETILFKNDYVAMTKSEIYPYMKNKCGPCLAKIGEEHHLVIGLILSGVLLLLPKQTISNPIRRPI